MHNLRKSKFSRNAEISFVFHCFFDANNSAKNGPVDHAKPSPHCTFSLPTTSVSNRQYLSSVILSSEAFIWENPPTPLHQADAKESRQDCLLAFPTWENCDILPF
ncbi:hypothetical protein ACTXT7_015504 [Hymenolepis weldensis]